MNYYQILGIDFKSQQNEIKKKYRELARIYHPDKNNGNDSKFKEIKKAYEELIDPEKRIIYDLSLKMNEIPFVKNFKNINIDDVQNMDFSTLGNLMSGFMFNSDKPNNDKPIPNIIFNLMKMYNQKHDTKKEIKKKINLSFSFNDVYKNKIKKVNIDNKQFLIPLNRRVYEIYNYKFNIHIKKIEGYTVIDDYDIEYDLEVSLSEALTKNEFYFIDPNKNSIKIQINKSILNNNEFKIENMGLPKKDDSRGDLYINFIINIENIDLDYFSKNLIEINNKTTKNYKYIKIN